MMATRMVAPLLLLLLAGPGLYVSAETACGADAVADLNTRVADKGFVATRRGSSSSWGPAAATFPRAAAPAGCDEAPWARARILGAIDRMVAQGFCYCHHHAPWWMPGPRAKNRCNPDCVGARPMPNQGADCSNYSAYLYNLAFGQRFTSAIGPQACKPGAAPGRVLPYTPDEQDMFRPGDLLFVTQSSSAAPPVRVSHVVLWTGYTVDFASSGGALSWDTLFANVKPSQQASVKAYADARRALGRPVYVINDSHWTGPNLRPFAGWYVSSFSHARRVIKPEASLPADDAAVAYWDGTNCMSYWARQGGGGVAGGGGSGKGIAALRAAAGGGAEFSDDAGFAAEGQ